MLCVCNYSGLVQKVLTTIRKQMFLQLNYIFFLIIALNFYCSYLSFSDLNGQATLKYEYNSL